LPHRLTRSGFHSVACGFSPVDAVLKGPRYASDILRPTDCPSAWSGFHGDVARGFQPRGRGPEGRAYLPGIAVALSTGAASGLAA